MGGVKSKLANSNVLSCCCNNQKENDSYHDLPRPTTTSTPTYNFSGCVDATTEGGLTVEKIDLCFERNGEDHHTTKFYLMRKDIDKCLVIRRGLAFTVDILLNRPYDKDNDAVSFIFHVADSERRGPSSNMNVAVPLLEKGKETTTWWSAAYESQTDSHLIVSVTPAADCVVALWSMEIDTKVDEGRTYSYLHPLPIYVLFNPWCKNDVVYMPDENLRREYVLEDGGIIFRGDLNIVKPTPWHYAQFDKDILDCALYLVREIAKVTGRQRGDPIITVRGLSAAININDDNGVLFGKWSPKPEDYNDGNHPSDWIGSLEILQKYYRYKEPVKYGQCWVFAGVLTTICRALGIPCRPVTCFNSAHDNDGSLTVDEVFKYDENGIANRLPKDSVWNYHVWNEVWMDRQDIGSDYSGWQIIDSTPQEKSQNIFRCGPAPLKAVYEGEIRKPYDVSFVFAEVNADRLTWNSTGSQDPKLISIDTRSVGQRISTKAVGSTGREDITHQYKDPEGSSEERNTFISALKKSPSDFARYYLNNSFSDIEFEVELRDDIVLGQDFEVILHMNNRSSLESHHIQGVLSVDSATYRGLMGANIKQQEIDLVIGPEKRWIHTLLVTFEDYYSKITEEAAFKIICFAKVAERNFEHISKDNFRLRNPDIKVTCSGEPVVGQPLSINLELKNPLPIPLKEGKFYVQGRGIDQQLTLPVEEDVPSGSAATSEFKIVPHEAGSYQVSVKFSSAEVKDVDGFFTIDVQT